MMNTPTISPTMDTAITISNPVSPIQRRVTGASLIVVPLVFIGAFAALGGSFEYPDILRKPSAYVLERFQAGGTNLMILWYGMLISALAFTAIPLLVRRTLNDPGLGLLLATVFGVLAGLVQALGFARWVFLTPFLAERALDPGSSEAARVAATVVFEAFNRYAGVGLGEHIGYLLTGLWTILVARALLKRSRFFTWLGWAGVVLGAGIIVGMLEVAGVSWAGAINAISYLIWAVWMAVFGLSVLVNRRSA